MWGFGFDSLPFWARSPLVGAQVNATLERCAGRLSSAGNLSALYGSLRRVFVFDLNGLTLNGLGNTLPIFTNALTTGAADRRAPFIHRHGPLCASDGRAPTPPDPRHCRMQPGRYLGALGARGLAGGFYWDWNTETRGRVAAVMAAAGEEEHVFLMDGTGWAHERTGARLPAVTPFPHLLALPEVARLAWITFRLAPPGAWDALAPEPAWRLPHMDGFFHVMLAGPLAQAALANLTNARGGLDGPCMSAPWMHATPLLQAALAEPIARVNAARRSGGALVGIHVRSGFADFVASPEAHQGVLERAAQRREAAGAGNATTSGDDAEQAMAVAWSRLDFLSELCGERYSGNLSAPLLGNATLAALGVDKGADVCWQPANNATAAAISSGGASCAADWAGLPSAAPPLPALAALRAAPFGLPGRARGIASVVGPCAFAAGAALAHARAASDAATSSNHTAVTLMYVAGDMPPLWLLLERHPLLGPITLSSPTGRIGHVSAAVTCAAAKPGAADPPPGPPNATNATTAHPFHACTSAADDPGGAWTRTMVDLWMLGACDAVVRWGGSSFVGAFRARLTWPQPDLELRVQMLPLNNHTAGRIYGAAFNRAVATLEEELSAEQTR